MKKTFRVLGIIFAILVLLIVVLTVAARILITPERIRATVLPMAKEALHREVEVGEINVSLFRGITLHDLNVRETDGKESFVSADQVVLRYQFWPLLFKRVVIDEVRLEAPRIRIERQADGSFSFSDLLPADKAASGAGEPARPEPSGESSIDLLVSEVTIRDGLVVFLDRVINPTAPLEYKLESLSLTASDISLQKDFPYSLQGRINGSPLEITGKVNAASRSGQASVRLDDLDVTVFSPYFAEKLPGKLGSLKLKLDLTADGSAEAVTSSGRIEMKQIDIVLDALNDAPLRDANVSLDYKLKADLAQKRLAFEEAKAAFNGIPLLISGTVENYAAAPAIDLQATIIDLDLRQALAALPPALVKGVKDMDPAGIVNLTAHLIGPVDKGAELLREAEVRLNGVQANVGGLRPAISGQLDLRGDTLVSRDLTMVAGDNKAAIELKASNLFGRPINVSSRITSERFNLEPLLQGAAAPVAAPVAAATPQQPKAPTAPAMEPGPFDLPLRADGSLQIGQSFYKGLTVDNFDLRYLLEKNILTVDRLSGKVAGGSFNQTARIDLTKKGLDYATRLVLKDVQGEKLVNAFFPKAAGSVFGAISLNADLNGRGTLPETLKRNLSGNGAFQIVDGKLTGTGLVKGLADFVNLEELRTLNFKQAKGAFTITNGNVSLNSDFAGSDVRFAPQGTVGLDGALDVALDLRLSPALTGKLDRRGNVAQYFTDAEGWGQLPLKATGTLGAPRFTLDPSAVKGKVKEKAREEIEKKLQEKVFDKLAPKEGEDGSGEPAKQMLEEGLKKLLGR
ncbi:MAG TPA: AsmA family protein [Desulfuromonadales bacterium]